MSSPQDALPGVSFPAHALHSFRLWDRIIHYTYGCAAVRFFANLFELFRFWTYEGRSTHEYPGSHLLKFIISRSQ